MDLEDLRSEIDALDAQIVKLLRDRAEVAQRIGHLKAARELPVYAPHREADILRRITGGQTSPFTREALVAIYVQIISACRALERPIRVAYLGPEFSWTHLAARKHLGAGCDFVPVPSIEDTFSAVEKRHCDYGVVPIENSIEGVVTPTLDRFVSSNLRISGELYYDIRHTLGAKCALGQVRRIVSFSQPLAQCRGWIREHLPNAEVIQAGSSSAAAHLAAAESDLAAISSKEAALEAGLSILAENIGDQPLNRTRFLVLGLSDCAPGHQDKTTILFVCDHQPGALSRALQPLAEHGVNLTMIQSRPARDRSWEYVFFADFQGHRDSPQARRALEGLRQNCHLVKVLGSYPVAPTD